MIGKFDEFLSESKKDRYSIMRGESAIEVASTNSLRDAKKLVRNFDAELSSDEWDNLEKHWILDNRTKEQVEID